MIPEASDDAALLRSEFNVLCLRKSTARTENARSERSCEIRLKLYMSLLPISTNEAPGLSSDSEAAIIPGEVREFKIASHPPLTSIKHSSTKFMRLEDDAWEMSNL